MKSWNCVNSTSCSMMECLLDLMIWGVLIWWQFKRGTTYLYHCELIVRRRQFSFFSRILSGIKNNYSNFHVIMHNDPINKYKCHKEIFPLFIGNQISYFQSLVLLANFKWINNFSGNNRSKRNLILRIWNKNSFWNTTSWVKVFTCKSWFDNCFLIFNLKCESFN